jgi:hypothetical protein
VRVVYLQRIELAMKNVAVRLASHLLLYQQGHHRVAMANDHP